ncbi:acyl-CoA desaturase [Ferruginibacter sp. HRS2-29]|uniref:fatty acid desaturase family protein n=1 Tax=Ferruginibacter sp. HRS2-29 TaxID=2487334 RepID=UPI0020CD67B7|nr:acyl-CoA desaturase [Ferruginibacter sp. HRS2-29]MCP9751711.1 acyl-CoA desaturase [Ferruginibacter sp. HRS2-29]
MAKITFNNKNNEFFTSLKISVDAYFKDNKIERTGDWRLFTKTIVLTSVMLGVYAVLMLVNMSALPALLLCVVLGYTGACIGFSVMHDANHGSYSPNQKLNDFLGLSANALGASSYFWKQKHNIIHHTYTNIDGIDDDIAKSPIIRQCESQVWVPAHKVQHLYLIPVYALSSIFWIFFMDFTKYFTRRIYTTEAWKLTAKNHVIFWLTKLHYAVTFIALPIYVWGWQGWLVGFLVMNAAMGLTLSLVFQLAHVVENTEFEHIPLDETKHLETAWAEHQIKTTANFAMGNKVISWFVGGLNYQIEHHLFPRVSHVHYPEISKIVQQKCKEFGLPYNQYPTFSEALASHFRVMRQLGVKPEKVVLETQQAA